MDGEKAPEEQHNCQARVSLEKLLMSPNETDEEFQARVQEVYEIWPEEFREQLQMLSMVYRKNKNQKKL